MKKFKAGQTVYVIWGETEGLGVESYSVERAIVTNEPPAPTGYRKFHLGRVSRHDLNEVLELKNTKILVDRGDDLMFIQGIHRSRRKAERTCEYINQFIEWDRKRNTVIYTKPRSGMSIHHSNACQQDDEIYARLS